MGSGDYEWHAAAPGPKPLLARAACRAPGPNRRGRKLVELTDGCYMDVTLYRFPGVCKVV